MTPFAFSDSVAIVTGASSGIGRATAVALARLGSRVVVAARREQALQTLVDEIDAGGGCALAVPTDVTDADQVDSLIETTLAQHGRIDLLVANAGAMFRCPVCDLEMETLERSMDVNFYGMVRCVRAVLPHMLSRRSGQIVLVTSWDARKGMPLEAGYVAAKCACTGYGDVLRQEVAPSGIRVHTVLPGRVDTELIDQLNVPLISKKIRPETVANTIIRCIRWGRARAILPASVQFFDLVDTVSPRFGDWLVRVFGLAGRHALDQGSN